MIEIIQILLYALTSGAIVFFAAVGLMEFMRGKYSKNWGVFGWAITGTLWLITGLVLALGAIGLKAVLA